MLYKEFTVAKKSNSANTFIVAENNFLTVKV